MKFYSSLFGKTCIKHSQHCCLCVKLAAQTHGRKELMAPYTMAYSSTLPSDMYQDVLNSATSLQRSYSKTFSLGFYWSSPSNLSLLGLSASKNSSRSQNQQALHVLQYRWVSTTQHHHQYVFKFFKKIISALDLSTNIGMAEF